MKRVQASFAVVLPVAILVATGCGDDKQPAIHLVMAHEAAAAPGGCYPAQGRPGDSPLSTAEVTFVRISVTSQAKNTISRQFTCDRLLTVPRDQPNLKLRVADAGAIDVHAEAFAPDDTIPGGFRRVATGSLLGIKPNAKSVPPLRLVPSQKFRCADSRMAVARAFHTATALPNGQVLIIGGVTASPSDATVELLDQNRLYATNSIELWDPADGKFHTVAPPDGTIARAFHHAAYVKTDTSTGEYLILVAGGLTSTDAGKPVLGLNTGGLGAQRLVPVASVGAGLQALPTRAAEAELLAFDPVTGAVRHPPNLAVTIDGTIYAAGADLDDEDGLAVVGGINFGDMDNNIVPVNRVQVNRGLDPTRAGPTLVARLGATLTVMGKDSALLFGGGLEVPSPLEPVAEVVRGLTPATPPTTTALQIAGTPMTQFHTATRPIPLAEQAADAATVILVTGGFQVAADKTALQPVVAGQAARIVSYLSNGTATATPAKLGAPYITDDMCVAQDRYRPAGFERAVALSRHRVLVTGGSPRVDTCNDCGDMSSNPLCAIAQASLFEGDTLSPALEPMKVPRYGHTATVLPDETVLLVGGMNAPGEMARVLPDAELYNPRTTAPPYDPMAAPTQQDPDDPLHALMSDTLQRAPGKLAVDPAKPDVPVAQCPVL